MLRFFCGAFYNFPTKKSKPYVHEWFTIYFPNSVLYSNFDYLCFQGKGTCKTYWLISAVPRPTKKVNKLLQPNGQPIMNYLNTPGHHFGSNNSLNLKRADSIRRSAKNVSPCPMKKNLHKPVPDEETAALLNQTSV